MADYSKLPIYYPAGIKTGQVSRFRMGVEVWQILTGITLVLSIASSMMWFSNLQPQALQQEFVWLSKAKATVFSMHHLNQVVFQKEQHSPIPEVTLQAPCYSQIREVRLDEGRFTKVHNYMNGNLEKLDQIQQEYPRSVQTLRNQSNMSAVLGETEAYTTEIKLYFENQALFYKHTLQIQNLAAQLCSQNLTQTSAGLQAYRQALQELPKTSLQAYEAWIQAAESLPNLIEELLKLQEQDKPIAQAGSELVSRLAKDFQTIFSVEYAAGQAKQNLESQSRKSLQALISQQDWEQEFIRKHSQYQKMYLPLPEKLLQELSKEQKSSG